jgi:hypothetical protein
MMTDSTGFYVEVRHAEHLPRRSHQDHRIVRRGFAAEIGGCGTELWFFFEHLELALVFGRSAASRCGSTGTASIPSLRRSAASRVA